MFLGRNWIHIQNIKMDNIERPNENDCCGEGCNPCILDAIELEIKRRKQKLLNEDSGKHLYRDVMFTTKYTEFQLIAAEQINNYKLMTFNYNLNSKDKQEKCILSYNSGQYFIIRSIMNVIDEKPHFTRSYTPLRLSKPIFFENKSVSEKVCSGQFFQIIVKIYEHGLMSQYLKSLNVGDITLWRGPYGDYTYKPNIYSNLLMICQGTAIAPMLAIITEILNNDEDDTKIMLHYCCRNVDNIIFRNELYSFKRFWNFSYKIFLSVPLNAEFLKYKEPIINKKLDYDELSIEIINKENIQILIAGSENFMIDFNNIFIKCNIKQNDIVLFR